MQKEVNSFGLDSQQVLERVEKGLVNGDQNVRTKTVRQILKTNVFTFFNLLFLIISAILWFFISQNSNGYMQFTFMLLVIFNTSIGLIQELKAKHTIDKLSLISAPQVTVVRDGKELVIKVSEIVLDDVMLLKAGDQICADAEIIEGEIGVNEAQVTGESDVINKNEKDGVLSGSYVISGRAYAVVKHIGEDNYATKIVKGAKYFKKPVSEILRALNNVIKVMAMLIVPLGLLLFIVKFFVHTTPFAPLPAPNFLQILGIPNVDRLSRTVIKVLATLLGMIPAGLLAMASTVFCISVIRLSKYKILAQDMYCIETLARVDVLCLDKTGTITEGSMQVSGVDCDGDREEFLKILGTLAGAVNDTNATAVAIREYLGSSDAFPEVDVIIPFSSERKWSGAVFEGKGYVLGAAEFVLPSISADVQARINEISYSGERVLVLAETGAELCADNLPFAKYLGLIRISDKVRADAEETMRYFLEQGVDIKVISGDNPITVKCVAEKAGLSIGDAFIDMSTLSTDEEVCAAAEKYKVFGRVKPQQKLLLIKTLKANGHTVAMTGDGVNDVLALKEADCSIAMSSGSDAAKNVSSMVLLGSNFSAMPHVVAEGRRSINNLERVSSMFLSKTIYMVLLAFMFMFISAELPFEPSDLTIISSLAIGIPSFFFAFEADKNRIEGRFLRKVLAKALPGGLVVVLGIFGIVVSGWIYPFNTVQLKGMYFFISAYSGFLFLARLSYPFSPLRAGTTLSMIGLFCLCFLVRFDWLNIPKLFALPTKVTFPMLWTMIIVATIITPIFAIIVTRLEKKTPKILLQISEKMEDENYNVAEPLDKAKEGFKKLLNISESEKEEKEKK